MADLRDGAGMMELYPSARSEWRGSYLGFTFNGIHSTSFGITRVSNGNRYDDELHPTIQDKVVNIPGADGTYFFESYYTQRTFSISFAFDNMSDLQLRQLKQKFGDKKVHPLIFDEMPYKVYYAKVTGMSTVKHLCFSTDVGGRIFKGEGSIQFTCYFPFGKSRYKYLDSYTLENIPEWNNDPELVNLEEWREGSGIDFKGINDSVYIVDSEELVTASYGGFVTDDFIPEVIPVPGNPYVVDASSISEEGNGMVYIELDAYFDNPTSLVSYDPIAPSGIYIHPSLIQSDIPTDKSGYVTYNPGDLPVDWTLKLISAEVAAPGSLEVLSTGEKLNIGAFILRDSDAYVVISSKTRLIEGYTSENVKSGNIYNSAIGGGEFFKIPLGLDFLIVTGFGIEAGSFSWNGILEYDYLYF